MAVPTALPEPSAYAVMSLEQRGAVCAALSLPELHHFAAIYAAFLDTLLDGSNLRTDPAAVFAQMASTAIAWREVQRCSVAHS